MSDSPVAPADEMVNGEFSSCDVVRDYAIGHIRVNAVVNNYEGYALDKYFL